MKDYELEEMTLIAILLFTENKKEIKDLFDKVFAYTNEDMIYSFNIKALYKLIKENYEKDVDILGKSQFAYKIGFQLEMEYKIPQTFLLEIQPLWLPPALLDKYIRAIHDRYFEDAFTKATTETEFNNILHLKEQYTLTDDMQNVFEGIEEYGKTYEKRRHTAVFTQYPSLNKVIGSWQGGDMIILAGGTGGGKTCAMLNLVTGIAAQGKKVDIFSLEMPREQLQQRMICAKAGINASKFREFSLTEEEKTKYISCANNEFANLNIRIYKKQTVSIEQIRYIVLKSDADIVFIDYLGLINSYSNKGTYERFSEISRRIKLLAMEANKPIVALHQLNREFQNREDKTPRLSDIRDSGKIEQDADMVLFVHRPGIYEPDKYAEYEMQIIIAKNRFGQSNKTLSFIFNGSKQKIEEPIKIVA